MSYTENRDLMERIVALLERLAAHLAPEPDPTAQPAAAESPPTDDADVKN